MIKNETIPLNCRIIPDPSSIASDMNGEKVMMNILNGNYYNLGAIGGRIWTLINDKPISANELVTTLMSEYDVEQNRCEDNVQSFLTHLWTEKLIHFGEVLEPQP